jgi:hypothetical protein
MRSSMTHTNASLQFSPFHYTQKTANNLPAHEHTHLTSIHILLPCALTLTTTPMSPKVSRARRFLVDGPRKHALRDSPPLRTLVDICNATSTMFHSRMQSDGVVGNSSVASSGRQCRRLFAMQSSWRGARWRLVGSMLVLTFAVSNTMLARP